MAAKRRGKVTIFPHAHVYTLPADVTRERLKESDVINIESAAEKGRLFDFFNTLKYNVLSRTGVSLFGRLAVAEPGYITEYRISLKKALSKAGRRIEVERGVPIARLLRSDLKGVAKALAERTQKDVKQVSKHILQGKSVAMLRGGGHANLLANELKKHGIDYEVIPLGGLVYNPKGMPLAQTHSDEFLLKYAKTGKRLDRFMAKPVPEEKFIGRSQKILESYPGLREHPTALMSLAVAMELHDIKGSKALEGCMVFDAAGNRWVPLSKLAKKAQ